MLLIRGAFWLVVLTLFLPPEYRPLPFVEFELPKHLGDSSYTRSDASIPDNHYCAEHKDVCVDVAHALDAITAIGLTGLGYVRSAIDSEYVSGDDDDEDKSFLGGLIDS